MGDFDQFFDDIDNVESMGGIRIPRLGAGQHTVILTGYAPRRSQRGGGTYLHAEFLIKASNTHKPGERRCVQWFPSGDDFHNKFEKERAKNFTEAIDVSLGINPVREMKITGGAAAAGQYCGIELNADAQLVLQDNGQPRKDRKGKDVVNTYFSAVSGQTLETIAATWAQVKHLAPAAPAPQRAQNAGRSQYGQQQYGGPHAAAQPQFAPPQYQAPAPVAPPSASPQGWPSAQPPAQPAPAGWPVAAPTAAPPAWPPTQVAAQPAPTWPSAQMPAPQPNNIQAIIAGLQGQGR